MCGIAGFIGQDQSKIERMTNALLHRGPDGNAVVVEKGISFGHARLAILDPRPVGDQPMWNRDRTVCIIYNGEIFNYRRLKESEGLQCETGTDTEVLLKLYEKEGIDFVKKLRGMFAFALYDTRTETLSLARDPNGIKPLFVSYLAGKPHFASEMRALLSILPSKSALKMDVLSQYLRLQYVPGPHTLCEGIESLPPGTVLTWKQGEEQRELVIPKEESPNWKSPQEFMERFPSVMDQAVQDHLVSDKPVGIFLSGGMDSSIVLHHMAHHAEKPIRTFTVRFDATEEEGAQRFNTDAKLAAMTAKHYGTEHHEILLSAAKCREIYKETARALDQPNADAVSTAQYLLSQEAKKYVDVVLTGAGGDELFGGYPRYRIARILHAMRMIPGGLRGIFGKITPYPSDVLAMHSGAALAERLLARPTEEIEEVQKGNWFDPAATTRLFEERFSELESVTLGPVRTGTGGRAQGDTSGVMVSPSNHDTPHPVRDFMEFDRTLWLVDESLRLADATTMASGLEARIPLLDQRVIAAAHCMGIPHHITYKQTKALLKKTYRNILPDHLFTLEKACFYPPLAKWIRRECSPLVEEMLENEFINMYFDTTVLRKVFEKHKSKEKYSLHTLSSLMQLSNWYETVYENK